MVGVGGKLRVGMEVFLVNVIIREGNVTLFLQGVQNLLMNVV